MASQWHPIWPFIHDCFCSQLSQFNQWCRLGFLKALHSISLILLMISAPYTGPVRLQWRQSQPTYQIFFFLCQTPLDGLTAFSGSGYDFHIFRCRFSCCEFYMCLYLWPKDVLHWETIQFPEKSCLSILCGLRSFQPACLPLFSPPYATGYLAQIFFSWSPSHCFFFEFSSDY